jgi:hypothetical protein
LSDPETAARKLIEIVNGVEAVQDGRIHIEKTDGMFLYEAGGTPMQSGTGIRNAIERGWIVVHEYGSCILFTQAGAASSDHAC